MMRILLSIFCFSFLFFSAQIFAQENEDPGIPKKDSTPVATKKIVFNKYDSANKAHPPSKAAFRSAVLPGWGQIYNKKYWKLPIVYGALGVTGYIFLDNIKTYKEYRFAYAARYKAEQPFPARDSTDYHKLKELYKLISPESIRSARNRFRQYVDYSAIFFLVFWGLNVVDATVDAHLKSFDVSPDLSLQIKPGHSEMAGTNGISLVLHIK